MFDKDEIELPCPKCGHEMKVVHIKDKEFLKCDFCGLESKNKHVYSFLLEELRIIKKVVS